MSRRRRSYKCDTGPVGEEPTVQVELMPAPVVQIISAPWCKRCGEIKPRVAELCRLAGVIFEEVNYDELEEDSALKASVTALPTIRMRVEGSGWKAYTPKELAAWEDSIKMMAAAAIAGQDLDF